MSSQSKWKLVAVLIVASALLGAVGWQQFSPKPVPPATVTVTPVATTVTGSQTTVVPAKLTEWVRVGEVKPVDYYLSLLFSNGTAPYGQLYWELRRLPDLTNATAVAKITYLVLNATNPEVKEAFKLMIEGGTPDPRDYKYSVPNYNTELQVLYWLACQNEFKKDDTLALAIAMVNGIWVAMGDWQVRQVVKNDSSDLLAFFRETSELQSRKGCPLLEDYPLEVKICLTWIANTAPYWHLDTFSLAMFTGPIQLSLPDYEWATVSLQTLRQMRDLMEKNRWIDTNCGNTVANLEHYFYFSNHWNYTYTTYLTIDGRYIRARGIHNVDWQFRYYLQNSKGIGVCGDEADLVDAFCKSWGIASTFVMRKPAEGTADYRMNNSHMYITYFDPSNRSWRAYYKQASMAYMAVNYTFYVFRPPVIQQRYLHYWKETSIDMYWYGNMFYIADTPYLGEKISTMLQNGVPTSQMKRWLLYS